MLVVPRKTQGRANELNKQTRRRFPKHGQPILLSENPLPTPNPTAQELVLTEVEALGGFYVFIKSIEDTPSSIE